MIINPSFLPKKTYNKHFRRGGIEMKNKLVLNFILLSILFFLCSCLPTSREIINSKKINNYFYVADDINHHELYKSVWYLKYNISDDSFRHDEGYSVWLRIFPKITHLAYNNNFIIAGSLYPKKHRYLIVLLYNEKVLKSYTFKNEMNFNKMKIELNIPDSLILEPIFDILKANN